MKFNTKGGQQQINIRQSNQQDNKQTMFANIALERERNMKTKLEFTECNVIVILLPG